MTQKIVALGLKQSDLRHKRRISADTFTIMDFKSLKTMLFADECQILQVIEFWFQKFASCKSKLFFGWQNAEMVNKKNIEKFFCLIYFKTSRGHQLLCLTKRNSLFCPVDLVKSAQLRQSPMQQWPDQRDLN